MNLKGLKESYIYSSDFYQPRDLFPRKKTHKTPISALPTNQFYLRVNSTGTGGLGAGRSRLPTIGMQTRRKGFHPSAYIRTPVGAFPWRVGLLLGVWMFRVWGCQPANQLSAYR